MKLGTMALFAIFSCTLWKSRKWEAKKALNILMREKKRHFIWVDIRKPKYYEVYDTRLAKLF